MNKDEAADLEEFLEKVNLVSKAVHGLDNGTVSLDQADRIANSLQCRDKVYEKTKTAVKSRTGKGESEDYKFFCRRCFIEYLEEVNICEKCNKETVSRDVRREELQEKVEDLKREYLEKEKRRNAWVEYTKMKTTEKRKSSTNYDEWDRWEPEIEMEDFTGPHDPNDPRFAALANDLEEREKERKKQAKLSKIEKEKGTKFFKKKDFKNALKHWNFALDHKKDDKSLWTNRALVHLKLKKWEEAIEDCTRCLEYWEFIERKKKPGKFEFKAYLRRAAGLKEKNEFEKALEDLREAQKINDTEEVRLLLSEYETLASDYKRLSSRKVPCDDDAENDNDLLNTIHELNQFELLACNLSSNKCAKIKDRTIFEKEEDYIQFFIQCHGLESLLEIENYDDAYFGCKQSIVLRHLVNEVGIDFLFNPVLDINFLHIAVEITLIDYGRRKIIEHKNLEKLFEFLKTHLEQTNLDIELKISIATLLSNLYIEPSIRSSFCSHDFILSLINYLPTHLEHPSFLQEICAILINITCDPKFRLLDPETLQNLVRVFEHLNILYIGQLISSILYLKFCDLLTNLCQDLTNRQLFLEYGIIENIIIKMIPIIAEIKIQESFLRLLDLFSQCEGVNFEPHLSLIIPQIELFLEKQNPSALRLLLRLKSFGKKKILLHFEKNITSLLIPLLYHKDKNIYSNASIALANYFTKYENSLERCIPILKQHLSSNDKRVAGNAVVCLSRFTKNEKLKSIIVEQNLLIPLFQVGRDLGLLK